MCLREKDFPVGNHVTPGTQRIFCLKQSFLNEGCPEKEFHEIEIICVTVDRTQRYSHSREQTECGHDSQQPLQEESFPPMDTKILGGFWV